MRLITAPTWSPTDRPPPWLKGRRWRYRKPEQVDCLLVHQTAVAGGFGAPSLEARVARYCGTSADKPGTPYHYVYSPKDQAVIALWHPRLHTYHGNGGNGRSVGFAVDGHWPGDELDADALEAATTLVLLDLEATGWWGPASGQPTTVKWLESHRQHSDRRGGDPGRECWQPIAAACARRAVFYRDRVTGSGRPVPRDWWGTIAPAP